MAKAQYISTRNKLHKNFTSQRLQMIANLLVTKHTLIQAKNTAR